MFCLIFIELWIEIQLNRRALIWWPAVVSISCVSPSSSTTSTASSSLQSTSVVLDPNNELMCCRSLSVCLLLFYWCLQSIGGCGSGEETVRDERWPVQTVKVVRQTTRTLPVGQRRTFTSQKHDHHQWWSARELSLESRITADRDLTLTKEDKRRQID